MKSLIKMILAGFIGGVAAFFIFKQFDKNVVIYENNPPQVVKQSDNTANNTALPAFDFTSASKITRPAVVHIRALNREYADYRSGRKSSYDFFYYNDKKPQAGTGSGVIISSDGYIVTNNHVVGYADIIEVTLNNGTRVKASKIGADPSTDLAVIKIEKSNLPYVKYGNSDQVQIGQWVVAVGNPFDLNSTVTAGIISAKGRDINLINNGKAIEEFLQTDAVVNPGNSGGALVDVQGNLVGINTAISSPTGVYAGYSFAIPSNLVKRVVNEIMEHGDIHRAFLGVNVVEYENGNQDGFKPGVYVQGFSRNSSARLAGIELGDRIVSVNGDTVSSFDELVGTLKFAKVGDVIPVKVIRNGQAKNINVKLRKGI